MSIPLRDGRGWVVVIVIHDEATRSISSFSLAQSEFTIFSHSHCKVGTNYSESEK